MGAFGKTGDDAGSSVLDALKTKEVGVREGGKEGVAEVKTENEKGVGKDECRLFVKVFTDVREVTKKEKRRFDGVANM